MYGVEFDDDDLTKFGAQFGVTAVTNASPAVVTTHKAHRLKSGDVVFIRNLTTPTNINGQHVVTVLSPTTFSVPVDTTATGAFVYEMLGRVGTIDPAATITSASDARPQSCLDEAEQGAFQRLGRDALRRRASGGHGTAIVLLWVYSKSPAHRGLA